MIPAAIRNRLAEWRPRYNKRLHYAILAVIASGAVLTPLAIDFGLIRITNIEFLNGMAWQDKAKAQSVSKFLPDGVVEQPPVAGTVPRGVRSYGLDVEQKAQAAYVLENPLPLTEKNLQRGRQIYEIYCLPCHGYKGRGDGTAVGAGRLPAPLSLHTDQALNYTDGQLFHIITRGQNTMPGYAAQIPPLERWAAVQYVRVLQRALAPTEADLQAQQALEQEQESQPDSGEESGS